MKNKEVTLERWEGGYWWLVDAKTNEPIDGDRRKYVAKDMAKRWGYIITKVIDKTK